MGVNMQIRTRTVLGVGLVLAVLVLPRMAAASVWTNAASDGQWLTTANWSGGVPNATNAVADFSQAIRVSPATARSAGVSSLSVSCIS